MKQYNSIKKEGSVDKKLKEFFKNLVEAPSPSGFEQPAQEVYRNFVKEFADEVKTDVHGNVIAFKKGSGKLKMMVSGHADEIGLMVNYIDDNGYIFFSSIGGVDFSLLPGFRVDVHTKKGTIRGVIGKKAIHMMEKDEMGKAPKAEDLWIDIGAKDKKDAEKRVSIGDPITFQAGMEELPNNLVLTKATDNKAGVFLAGALLRYLKKTKISVNLYCVSSVQEEIGLRGAQTSAFGIDPDIGLAFDVTLATDYPNTSKKRFGDISLNKGPVISRGANINPVVYDMLVKTAEKNKLAYQISGEPRGTGTDANIMQLTRSGVATGLISFPNRYMHTPVEIISFKDLENAITLAGEFVKKIGDKVDFIPKV
ncbi:M42 family metallopeptidase [candidate division WOR-3 bacterium]|nr:M42 family metallopeptidase [candidate division WOR-3 bacterium]MCK4528356.1 M42 family metallopeptidase [candidate division WOR-3 bacterium]